jgi:hypothetical protein
MHLSRGHKVSASTDVENFFSCGTKGFHCMKLFTCVDTSTGNTLMTSTVQKRYCVHVQNVFITIWTGLTHKCCHYRFSRVQLTLYSPQLLAEHGVNWHVNKSYSATVKSEIRTAMLMKIQPSLLWCYGLSTGKQLPTCHRSALPDFRVGMEGFHQFQVRRISLLPFLNSNALNSTQFQAPVTMMFAHIRTRHNNRVSYSINYISYITAIR